MRIQVNGTELYYQVQGQGRPLILLHGNGESGKIFDKVVAPLARDYQVHIVDSRGQGQSCQGVPVDYRLMAEDIRQFICRLGLEKPALYGFSDGGIVGLMLASQWPELLSCLAVSGANANPQGLRARWQMFFGLWAAFSADPLIRMIAQQPRITSRQLGQIRVPTLVLAGQRDMVRPEHTRWLAQSIPGARLAIVPGGTHGNYIVHSPLLYDYLKEFLAQHLGGLPAGEGEGR